MKRIITTFLTLALLCVPCTTYAASPYWKSVKAKAVSEDTVKLNWKVLTKAQQKKISGIAVFRDGKAVKRLSKKAKSYSDTELKAGKTYKYQLKTYKKTTKKVTMYYNKATGKWQTKKIKGAKKKTARKTTYKYANASKSVTATTEKAESEIGAPQNVKAVYTGEKGDGKGGVTVSWDKVSGAEYYWVHNSFGEPKDSDYTHRDFTLPLGKTYTFQVTAVKNWTEGPKSKAVSVTLPAPAEDPDDPEPDDPKPDTPSSDKEAPTATITTTKVSSDNTGQDVFLTAEDNVGVTAYYWGTDASPAGSSYKSNSKRTLALRETVNAAGTYYFLTKDAAGNTSAAASMTFTSVTDYKGTVRTRTEGSEDCNNPLYNRNIDGIVYGEDGTIIGLIQKNGVSFKMNAFGDYVLDFYVYNGDVNKLTYELSVPEVEYTVWGGDLYNPTKETATCVLGEHGRRVAKVNRGTDFSPRINAYRSGISLQEGYCGPITDTLTLNIIMKYDGEVLYTHPAILGHDNDEYKDENGLYGPTARCYKIAMDAVNLYRGGGSVPAWSQEKYQQCKQQYGDYIADMRAIEYYVNHTYTYDYVDCWAGESILDTFSAMEYGIYGHTCFSDPSNTSHHAFRPDYSCENGDFSGPNAYFQTQGHHGGDCKCPKCAPSGN